MSNFDPSQVNTFAEEIEGGDNGSIKLVPADASVESSRSAMPHAITTNSPTDASKHSLVFPRKTRGNSTAEVEQQAASQPQLELHSANGTALTSQVNPEPLPSQAVSNNEQEGEHNIAHDKKNKSPHPLSAPKTLPDKGKEQIISASLIDSQF